MAKGWTTVLNTALIAQWTERPASNRDVGGSNPSRGTNTCGCSSAERTSVFYQNAPQCTACNRVAVQGVVKRRYRS